MINYLLKRKVPIIALLLALIVCFLATDNYVLGKDLANVQISNQNNEIPTIEKDLFNEVVNRIDTEASYIEQFSSLPREFIISISAMNYIQSHLSPYIYGALRKSGNNPNNIEDAIRKGAGLCGLQAELFMKTLEEFGIKTRAVQIYSIDRSGGKNHITTEVWFNNKWNFFDITYGTIFRDPDGDIFELMSFEEILNTKDYVDYAIINKTSPINILTKDFNYISSTTKDIIISGSGTIRLEPVKQNELLVFSLTNLPNTIGQFLFSLESNMACLDYHLKGIEDVNEIILDIKALGGSGNILLKAKGKNISKDLLEVEKGPFSIDVSDMDLSEGLNISVAPKKDGEHSYIVLNKITAR